LNIPDFGCRSFESVLLKDLYSKST